MTKIIILLSSILIIIKIKIVSSQSRCDTLILSGMRDCLTKFAPTKNSNPCCAYRKYLSCTAGIRSGVQLAGNQAGCTNSLLSKVNFNSISNRLTGVSLNNCKDVKKLCRKSSSSSSSTSTSTISSKKSKSKSKSKSKNKSTSSSSAKKPDSLLGNIPFGGGGGGLGDKLGGIGGLGSGLGDKLGGLGGIGNGLGGLGGGLSEKLGGLGGLGDGLSDKLGGIGSGRRNRLRGSSRRPSSILGGGGDSPFSSVLSGIRGGGDSDGGGLGSALGNLGGFL